jgi:hypothetical protein
MGSFIVNGNYALSDKFGVSFNAGATSRHENYDRQGVTSTDQEYSMYSDTLIFLIKLLFNIVK